MVLFLQNVFRRNYEVFLGKKSENFDPWKN